MFPPEERVTVNTKGSTTLPLHVTGPRNSGVFSISLGPTSQLFRDNRHSGLCTRVTVSQVTPPHFLSGDN